MGRLRRWTLNVLIGLDQLGNALLGGHPDETISSRLGKHKARNGGVVPWRTWLGTARVLDNVLEWLDPGHSIDAIEHDEGDPV